MPFKICILIAELALLIPQAQDPRTSICTGTLVHAHNRRVCVKSTQALHLYDVATRCEVTLDELPATFDDLESGQIVTLTVPAGRPESVRKIEAFSTPINGKFPLPKPRRRARMQFLRVPAIPVRLPVNDLRASPGGMNSIPSAIQGD